MQCRNNQVKKCLNNTQQGADRHKHITVRNKWNGGRERREKESYKGKGEE